MLVLVVIGVILGLVRLRSGSILGPVLIHGLYDVLSVYLFRGIDRSAVGIENVVHRIPVLLADVLFLSMLVYLLCPGVFARFDKRTRSG
jgi:membrane protease YdiL (CAAX protease family)